MVLTAGRLPSDHDDPSTVIAGLREVFSTDPDTEVHLLQLPAGPALAVLREEPAMIEIEGAGPLPILQRQILTWIPDPVGSVVAVLGVASNCWQDWHHVCDVALDVVESLSWDDSAAIQTAPSR